MINFNSSWGNRKRCGNWYGRRIRRCFRQLLIEITNTFINDASGEIDIAALDGMDATSLTDLDADAAKELIQTRGAMAELMRLK